MQGLAAFCAQLQQVYCHVARNSSYVFCTPLRFIVGAVEGKQAALGEKMAKQGVQVSLNKELLVIRLSKLQACNKQPTQVK